MQDRRKIDQFTPERNLGGQIKVDWGPDNLIIAGVVLYTSLTSPLVILIFQLSVL